ncbi:MAG TPA: PqqD family protein [Thermoanaerobaculia bacterium]|nr:PqqD family protein [Thermoanaerobaculia bacterium]
MSPPSSTLTSTVVVPERVLFRDLAGEGVLLELDSGRYFGLNETGTRMWRLLVQHGRVEAALEALLEEYEVPRDRLREELLEFVDALLAQRLLDLRET